MGSSRKASATSSKALAAIQKSVMSLFYPAAWRDARARSRKGCSMQAPSRRGGDVPGSRPEHRSPAPAGPPDRTRAAGSSHSPAGCNERSRHNGPPGNRRSGRCSAPPPACGRVPGADPSRWARWNRRCSDSGTSDNAALRSTSGSARVRPHRETRRCRSLPGPWKPGTAPAAQRGSIVSFVHQLLIERCELLAPDTIIDHADELVTDDALLVDQEGLGRAVYAQVQAQAAALVTNVQLVGIVKFLQPFLRRCVVIIVVDAMDDHALRGPAIEYRGFDLAGDTPGCPHVDQCGFALEICVGDQAL